MFRSMLLIVLAACEPRVDWALETLENVGDACLEGQAGAEATVQVVPEICLSSSCSRDVQADCSVSRDGDVLTVTSAFSWEEASGRRLACTADCGRPAARCSAGALDAGTYTIVHGGVEVLFEIPAGACSVF